MTSTGGWVKSNGRPGAHVPWDVNRAPFPVPLVPVDKAEP